MAAAARFWCGHRLLGVQTDVPTPLVVATVADGQRCG